WCRVNFAGETGFANRRYLAMAGRIAPGVGVAVAPGYVYDDTPPYAYNYDSYDDGYAYGPGVGVFVGSSGRFPHRGNWDGRVGTWQGRTGWNGTRTGTWQGRTGMTGMQSGTASAATGSTIGGRASVSAPVGMPTGGG